jgi:hypothetical protein
MDCEYIIVDNIGDDDYYEEIFKLDYCNFTLKLTHLLLLYYVSGYWNSLIASSILTINTQSVLRHEGGGVRVV